jgi:hypothetical protein
MPIQMFQQPAMITLSIAATRMYRSLSDVVYGSLDKYDFPPCSSFPSRLLLSMTPQRI